MRREDVADNVRGGLSFMVGRDVVGVSACDYDVGWWKALFIVLVRRGVTGRGRFTNRPYVVYGRAERRVCVCVTFDSVDVSACACDVGWWKALFIVLVRRGVTGRGRFTNRPYGLYGRSERRVCACVGCDVVICASGSIGYWVTNSLGQPYRRGGS